jgi:hypothetical protein
MANVNEYGPFRLALLIGAAKLAEAKPSITVIASNILFIGPSSGYECSVLRFVTKSRAKYRSRCEGESKSEAINVTPAGYPPTGGSCAWLNQ